MPGSRWRPVPVAASGGGNLPAEKNYYEDINEMEPLPGV